MEENKKVKIILTGAVNYKSEITLNTAASILHLCSVTPEGKNDTKTFPPELQQGEKISLGEYVHKHQPTTYPEKIIAIAAYQQEIKGHETFSPEDIRPLFKDIGEVPPKNFSRDFWNAVSNSWIAKDDSGSFYVANLGFKALKSSFSEKEGIKKHKFRKRKKKNSSAGSKSTEK